MLFLTNGLLAQEYTHYTEKDGLIGNFIYRGLQDRDGFIWLITDKGMSKFDGKTFKNFTTKDGLPANDIWHIRVTPDNRVWYFTRSDHLGYVENDSVYVFPSSDGEMMNPNGKILQSGNEISIISSKNTYHFADSVWNATKNDTLFHSLLNHDYKIRFEDKKFEYLEGADGKRIHEFKRNLGYSSIYQFSDSIVAFNSASHYDIINLNNQQVKTAHIPSVSSDSMPNLYSMFSLLDDKLQLSLSDQLVTFDEDLNKKVPYVIPEQLNVAMSFEDRDGFIWSCTRYAGVYKLPISYDHFKHLFNGKIISKLREIDGVVYVGLDEEAIYTVTNEKSALWIRVNSTIFNIVKMNEATVAILRNHFYIDQNSSIEVIPTGPLFGPTNNLVTFKNTVFTEGFSLVNKIDWELRTQKNFSDHSSYQGLFEQLDSLFIFNYKKMLTFDIEQDKFISYKSIEIGAKVFATENYENQTYIATEGKGLYVFCFGKLEKLVASDRSVITNLSVENHNSIWAVSEGTLLHYIRGENGQFSIKKHSHINGYPTSNVIDVLIFNNDLYIGSSAGLTIINTADISEEKHFQPYIKAVSVAGKKLRKDSLNLLYDSNLNLKIDFGAINFFDPKNDVYQYRLSPDQEEWTTTISGEVNLYNLKPNKYELQLKVKQEASEKILGLPITIRPLWWQHGITRGVSIFLAVGLTGLLLYLIRKSDIAKKTDQLTTQKKLAEYELYALRSQMNPHFVFNSLAAIQYYINENDFVTSDKYLVKFSKLIRQFFELSKEEKISVANEIELLKNYLEIEKMRFKDKLNFDFMIDYNLNKHNTVIPTMLLQPVVENAVNHGIFNKETLGTVSISFKQLGTNQIRIEIEDDGVGIRKTKKKHNRKINSSMILQDRIAVLNASQNWKIVYTTEVAFPKNIDKGNKSTFIIEKI